MARMTGKRAASWVTVAMALVTLSRVCVLFLETLSEVRDERNADLELLDVCRAGAAKASSKMRAACLAANAERASPILLKAVVRAVSTTFREFTESVQSPLGFATVVLFVVSSLVLPITPIVKLLGSWNRKRRKSAARVEDSDSDEESNPNIIVFDGFGGMNGSFRGTPHLKSKVL